MASIQDRRKQGRGWVVRYREPNGKQRSQSLALKERAKAFANEVEADKNRGAFIPLDGAKVLFSERWVVWLAAQSHLKATTKARDISYHKTIIGPTFDDMALGAIDYDACQTWVADLVEKGYAAGTIIKAVQIASKVMKTAVKAKLIASNPFELIDNIPDDNPGEMRALNPAEVARLADAIDDRYRTLVLVAAYCGLRAGELMGLTVKRLDFAKNTVTVWDNAIEVSGKVTLGTPKTDAGKRVVPMPKSVGVALQQEVKGRGPDDLVWTAPEGGVLRQSLFRRRFWAPATVAAGLAEIDENQKASRRGAKTFKLHELRHTAITLWFEHGATPLEVKDRAGSTSMNFIMDRYGHLLKKDEDPLTDALDAALTKATVGAKA